MVALLPAAGALRDAFLAAGLGFLLGLCYRAARFALGDSKPACFVCDLLLCAAAAFLYRAAAVGSFAAGVMRWYTAASMLLGYALCQKIFAKPLLRMSGRLRFLALWPFRAVHRYMLYPVWVKMCAAGEKQHQKKVQKRAAMREKCKRDLPKGQHMLYNSQ